ncbi:MAG: hypothetical protein V7642_2676, partial [Burkholderiales bacterium]
MLERLETELQGTGMTSIPHPNDISLK